jgi:hypothetical protein
MAVCGGKPKKMRTGMVRRLVPPTRVPKEAPIMLVKKMIDRPERFMMHHDRERCFSARLMLRTRGDVSLAVGVLSYLHTAGLE